jgi:hypothetical protein
VIAVWWNLALTASSTGVMDRQKLELGRNAMMPSHCRAWRPDWCIGFTNRASFYKPAETTR